MNDTHYPSERRPKTRILYCLPNGTPTGVAVLDEARSIPLALRSEPLDKRRAVSPRGRIRYFPE